MKEIEKIFLAAHQDVISVFTINCPSVTIIQRIWIANRNSILHWKPIKGISKKSVTCRVFLTHILKQILLNSYCMSSDQHCGASIEEDIYLWPVKAGV